MWWKKDQAMDSKKYHTLLIMSSTSGKSVIQLSFPVFFWWVSFVIAGLILFWIGAGTWSAFENHKIKIRSNCMEKENQLVNSKLKEQTQEIEYLRGQVKKIQTQAAFIKNYLGLGSNGPAKGTIGQGGGDFSSLVLPEVSQSLLGNQTLPTVKELSQSQKLSHKNISRLDSDLVRITSILEKRQREFEYIPTISPVDHRKSWISCAYGMRISPFSGKKQFHAGIDIAGWKGTPILAPGNGKVEFVRTWGSMGLTIKIRHNSSYITTYGHLLKTAVTKGQHVKRGEIIGYMGNSGRSTGYHLHYEIKKNKKRINPFYYMIDWDENLVLAAGDADG